MTNANTKLQKLDEATKARAEQTIRIFTNIPPEQEPFFFAIANAYLDGLIMGRELEANNNAGEVQGGYYKD